MHVLITGGTGFLGSAVGERLLADGHRITVLSRDPQRVLSRFGERAAAVTDPLQLPAEDPAEAIVNLAGQNLGSGRWNPRLKRLFVDSRIGVTRRIVAYIAAARPPPRVLLSGSAVGYYGARGEMVLDEAAGPAEEFQSRLCQQWEQAALEARRYGVRVCLSRTGLVLAGHGGALPGLLPPFRRGLGASVGNGRQWLSWIHLQDLVEVFVRLLNDAELSGPFNVTAPRPARNRDFAAALGRALGRRVWLRIPAWMVRLAVGEMAHLYVTGQRVVPAKLQQAGYRFAYPDLDRTLGSILQRSGAG